MQWNELVAVPSWTPLKTLCDEPVEIGENLYQIGEQQFVLALPHDREFSEGLPEAPFVTVVYWAPNAEAAIKCALRRENEYIDENGTPPPTFLHGTSGTYQELCATERVQSCRSTAEQAVYSGTTGKFVYKVIDTGQITYCFLKREIQPDEMPYAIEISLK